MSNCMPPIPNCLGRDYLDSAVQFSIEIARLLPNTRYFFRIESRSLYSDAYIGSLYVYFSITLPQNAPPASPVLVAAQSITTTSAVIRWANVEGMPTEYRLSVATDSTFQNLLPQYADVRLMTTSLALTGLQAETLYFVRVRAVNNVGTSAFSQTLRFQTLAATATRFSAENRSSALGFPNAFSVRSGSPFYRLGTGLANLQTLDSFLAALVQRDIPIVEAWAQDNNTCSPNQQSGSELVVRLREVFPTIANLGYTQTAPIWADSCSCKTFRVYGKFPTSTGITSDEAAPFTISPNPTTDAVSVSVTLPSSLPLRISVFDALGQEVRAVSEGFSRAGQNTLSFSTEGLPSGMYFVRCSVGGQVFVRRLAVVR
ncbi:MAG: fibronectin type III domain-containing protein [Candidatus Kapabacteria bacterium]|nr:fibronectin type III domain-containing protein [Candidatus Kapabacteria bacterium]